ncbi:MAG: cell division protein ZapA [Bacteroidales bacterium]|nr:cell division protein ZapA [Bacteroidales bacterium]
MEQEHRIKVKIADRSYNRTIHSELEEEAIRKAAQSINEKIASLSRLYAQVPLIDIITIVALNEGIEKFEAQRKLDENDAQTAKLSADLKNYVESLK